MNPSHSPPPVLPLPLPLPDEPFVAVWEEYAREATGANPGGGGGGLLETLREKLVQLRFPVAAGVSQTPAYLAATRRGIVLPAEGAAEPLPAPPVRLEHPDRLELRFHPTPAGRLPVLFTPWRRDFETLVQVFVHRNEPHPIPYSNGACLIAGLNNWDRVARLRAAWTASASPSATVDFFAYLKECRPLYQDCFLLLSENSYSGLDAAALGLGPERWRQLSGVIRAEHEGAHYCARRLARLGGDQAIFDELVADYWGIRRARGQFSADWLLRFLGLEGFPAGTIRADGRFANYRAAAGETVEQVIAATLGLERFDRGCDPAVPEVYRLLALLPLSLEELAARGAASASPLEDPAWCGRLIAAARARYAWNDPIPS